MRREETISRLQEAESYVAITINEGYVYVDIDLIDDADRKEFVDVLGEELAKLKRAKLKRVVKE